MSSSSTTLPTSEGLGSISGAPKSTGTTAVNADMAVRPFRVDIAEEAVTDLRRRIAAWRPSEREPVDDQSQGVRRSAHCAEGSPAGSAVQSRVSGPARQVRGPEVSAYLPAGGLLAAQQREEQ